ncbi:MAG: class I tRNA ligase family protein, partial [Oscillospiraceae bacterium]|nr:class I tRNA ligase family protein [Oscillospiraceae bacterium]
PKYGADIIRLWAASADYRNDMRCSEGIFKQLSEVYLKIRNTARFILGNLNGFDPDCLTPVEEMDELDRWAVSELNRLVSRCREVYEDYEFYNVIHAVHKFCVVSLSNFYLDIIKDRLYCDGTDSPERRSAQSAMYMILDAMVRLLAPLVSFTADEIWLAMTHDKSARAESVMLNDMPQLHEELIFEGESSARWDTLISLRDDVNRVLEAARGEKIIGKPLEAAVTLHVSEAARADFDKLAGLPLDKLFIVSEVFVDFEGFAGTPGENFPGIGIEIAPSAAGKCPRCWTHSTSVGQSERFPELCERCAKVLEND